MKYLSSEPMVFNGGFGQGQRLVCSSRCGGRKFNRGSTGWVSGKNPTSWFCDRCGSLAIPEDLKSLTKQEFEHLMKSLCPKLYVGLRNASGPRMLGGIDTGPGWRRILFSLSVALEKLITDPGTCVAQVKEKFAGLSFYMDGETPEMSELIRTAHRESLRTCEECGEFGTVCGEGHSWILTLCEKCSKARDTQGTSWRRRR